MVRQEFYIGSSWRVIAYYNVDYTSFGLVKKDLEALEASQDEIEEIYRKMSKGEAKAVTFSSRFLHASIVLFNRHSSLPDYLNSIVHEAEHVKQAVLKAYRIDDFGEEPAYTVGYIVERMYRAFRNSAFL